MARMIHIAKNRIPLAVTAFLFPAGEVGAKLDTQNLLYRSTTAPHQTIWARLQSSKDVMELVMITDALRRFDPTPINLVLSYVPYARQDRVCVPGESFSLKAFAGIINGLGFQKVTVFDPHSDVTGAVFDRIHIIPQVDIIPKFDAFNARLQPALPDNRPVFVSPDAGANKRTAELAGLYGHASFIRADKLRDLATGKIKEILAINPREEIEGRDCVVLDDLGDKCGTFIGLAKALKAKGARTVEIYFTHGLFTAPLDSILGPLFEAGVTRVWTTNSYRTDLIDPRLTVLNLEDVFAL